MTDQTQNETLPQRPSALPDTWIEALFLKLATMYGNRFTDMWRGVDSDKVKQTWAERLVVYPPEVLKYALAECDNFPSPPSLPQFIQLCRAGMNRHMKTPALPAPQMDKATARARLREICEKTGFPLKGVAS